MKFKAGDLVKPVRRWRRFGGGTLAMVITESKEVWWVPHVNVPTKDRCTASFLWLNGDNAGEKIHESADLFKVVSK